LLAPLASGQGAARPGETLHAQLARWWQLLAQAALVQPAAFAFWRQYRTSCAPLATDQPDLGPFVPFLAHVEPVLAAPPAGQEATLATSPTLLAEWLAAQWLAAVEVSLSNHRCRAQPTLCAHLLDQACAGWWLSTGLLLDTPRSPTRLPPRATGWVPPSRRPLCFLFAARPRL
jgi:hypothetical protein